MWLIIMHSLPSISVKTRPATLLDSMQKHITNPALDSGATTYILRQKVLRSPLPLHGETKRTTIVPIYANGGLWLKFVGEDVKMCMHMCRAILDHAPIGDYYYQFNILKAYLCLCCAAKESCEHMFTRCPDMNTNKCTSKLLNELIRYLWKNPLAFGFKHPSEGIGWTVGPGNHPLPHKWEHWSWQPRRTLQKQGTVRWSGKKSPRGAETKGRKTGDKSALGGGGLVGLRRQEEYNVVCFTLSSWSSRTCFYSIHRLLSVQGILSCSRHCCPASLLESCTHVRFSNLVPTYPMPLHAQLNNTSAFFFLVFFFFKSCVYTGLQQQPSRYLYTGKQHPSWALLGHPFPERFHF
jgi:hypothetical protein